MSRASIELTGLREAMSRLNQIVKNAELVIPEFRAEAKYAREDMQSIAPVKTGFLRDNIVDEPLPDGARVWSKADYSQAVERGTAPHIIIPKIAKALHWVGKDGKDIFAHKVMHPGTRPRPFFSAGVYASIPRVQQKVLTVMKN